MSWSSRKCREIGQDDASHIVPALEGWAEGGDFVALRTRAFVYLLWDGALRTRAALSLTVGEVATLGRGRPKIRRQVLLQSEGEAGRRVALSDRARMALEAYLSLARQQGCLTSSEEPLFLSSRGRAPRRRMSQRTAVHAWQDFLKERVPSAAQYQLDDVVFSGRMAFLRAADGDARLLAEHAGISLEWAHTYVDKMPVSPASTRDVLLRIHGTK